MGRCREGKKGGKGRQEMRVGVGSELGEGAQERSTTVSLP